MFYEKILAAALARNGPFGYYDWTIPTQSVADMKSAWSGPNINTGPLALSEEVRTT